MHTRHSLRSVIIGLIVGLATMLVLSAAPAAARQAEQDDTPTPEPAIPTATPTFTLVITSELAAGGDQDGDDEIEPGDIVAYTITLANSGQTASGPVEVVWEYDAAFISGVTQISNNGSLVDEGRVMWQIAAVDPGESIELSLLATLKARFPPGRNQLASTATVQSGATEFARAASPPLEVLGPVLQLTEVSSELVTDANSNGWIDPGDAVRFIISYSNSGGGPSQEASIVADYPEEFTRQIVNNPYEAQDDGSSLTWLVGSIPADAQTRTVSFTVTLSTEFPPGQTTYDVAISLRAGTVAADQRPLSVQVAGPNLTIRASHTFITDASQDGLVDEGDTIQVELQYQNVGSESATNATLTYEYDPARLEIIEVGQEGTDSPDVGVITWQIGVLERGGGGTATFQGRVLTLLPDTPYLLNDVTISSDQASAETQHRLPVTSTVAPELTPTAPPLYSEVRPAQGEGLLSPFSVAILIGGFLLLSLLSLTYVASRVLPGTPEERHADDEESRIAQRRLVREIVEGVVLTAILFTVMVLGLQNALDQDSVNSIVAGIVGYVAGRVASQG
jgi:hypothetical protein